MLNVDGEWVWALESMEFKARMLRGLSEELDPQDAFSRLMYVANEIEALAEKMMVMSSGGFYPMPPLLWETVRKIDELYKQSPECDVLWPPFVPMFPSQIDLLPGKLGLAVAMDSLGLALSTVLEVGIAKHGRVLLFSMTPDRENLGMQMISLVGKIAQDRLHTGQLEDSDWEKLHPAVGQLAESPIFVDFNPSLTVPEIVHRTRTIWRHYEKRIDLVVIADARAIPGMQPGNACLPQWTGMLKYLARDISVPILLLRSTSLGSDGHDELAREVDEVFEFPPIGSGNGAEHIVLPA